MDTAPLLASLHRLSARTEAAERKILAAAMARRAEVDARLAALRDNAVRHTGDDYQALVLERGQLDHVITLAEARLAE